jgi:outer membrane protein assembly factor BamB
MIKKYRIVLIIILASILLILLYYSSRINEIWKIETAEGADPKTLIGYIVGSAADKNQIYVACVDAVKVYSKNNGKMVWKYPCHSWVSSYGSTKINLYDNLCIVATDEEIIALDKNLGTVKWKIYSSYVGIVYSQVIDGKIYFNDRRSFNIYSMKGLKLFSTSYLIPDHKHNFYLDVGIFDAKEAFLNYGENIYAYDLIKHKIIWENKIKKTMIRRSLDEISKNKNILVLISKIPDVNVYSLLNASNGKYLDIPNEINAFSFYNDDDVIICSDNKIQRINIAKGLNVWNYEIEPSMHLRRIQVEKGEIYCLFKHQLTILDGQGKMLKSYKLNEDADEILDIKDDLIIIKFGIRLIKCFRLK